jgi:hypothetical protein
LPCAQKRSQPKASKKTGEMMAAQEAPDTGALRVFGFC